MLIGYARVSTTDQDTAAQGAALKAAGCELIFREKVPSGRWDRPELNRLFAQLRKGDVLVVLMLMERIRERKAGFRSLTEAIDTTTPAGRMMMQMVGAFAEFERVMLKERTKAGLDSARKDGRIGGRRPKLKPQQQLEIVRLVKIGEENRCGCGAIIRRPPGHRIAAFAQKPCRLTVVPVPLLPNGQPL